MAEVWSSVGSAGAVNIADLGKVFLNGSIVQLGIGLGGGATAEAASVGARAPFSTQPVLTHAMVRYGVAPSDPLEVEGNPLGLRLRYRDGEGYVVARFIQVDLLTGTDFPLINWDSRKFPLTLERNNFRLNEEFGNVRALNFTSNAYYVELTLSALESPIRPLSFPPAVSIIQLARQSG